MDGVDVRGEVVSPGYYTLPEGSRVHDAVNAAGGLKPGVNPVENLAMKLEDSAVVNITSVPAPASSPEPELLPQPPPAIKWGDMVNAVAQLPRLPRGNNEEVREQQPRPPTAPRRSFAETMEQLDRILLWGIPALGAVGLLLIKLCLVGVGENDGFWVFAIGTLAGLGIGWLVVTHRRARAKEAEAELDSAEGS